MQDWLHNIDFFIAIRSDVLTPAIKALSVLGDSNILLIFLPIGYWTFSKNVFARWGLLVLLNVLLMAYLKELFKDPRPDVVFQLDNSLKDSYGFPSGHAQLAVVAWLWIGWEVRKTWVWILSSFLIVGICFSRLYLGVHDLEDVIGGTVIGLLSLVIFIFITSKKLKSVINITHLGQILTLAAIEIFFIITWPGKVPEGVSWVAVFLIGFYLGLIIEKNYINFKKHHNWLKIFLSGLVGTIIYLLIRLELQILINNFESIKLIIFYVNAFVCGVYITALAPWIFQRLHLVE
jgi:membrane-associated phospholipid phosphatase